MKTNSMENLSNRLKLRLLREIDRDRPWRSLDDRRHCVICERTISGHQIRVAWFRHGAPHLRCPTPGCRSLPQHWVHPENPLTSEDAWRDWARLLEDCEAAVPTDFSGHFALPFHLPG